MNFSELMKIERKSRRMTMRDLFGQTDIKIGRLSDIEQNRGIPTTDEKGKICFALDIYHQDLTSIPKKFYNDNDPKCPVEVVTVGELIEVLKELPENLEIKQGFEDGVQVAVYNVGKADVHLEFCETEIA